MRPVPHLRKAIGGLHRCRHARSPPGDRVTSVAQPANPQEPKASLGEPHISAVHLQSSDLPHPAAPHSLYASRRGCAVGPSFCWFLSYFHCAPQESHLYSSCRRCRSCWNSPMRSRSFLRSAAVIAVRVRSLLLPGPQPCSRSCVLVPFTDAQGLHAESCAQAHKKCDKGASRPDTA